MELLELEGRSGGFPKFPVRNLVPNCGTRVISHFPQRANAKIVGGTNTPYGAYPWQVITQLIYHYYFLYSSEVFKVRYDHIFCP